MPSLETKSLHAKGQLSLHVATESLNSSAHAPQQEKPPRWEAHAPQLETSPYWLQVEKGCVHQWRACMLR